LAELFVAGRVVNVHGLKGELVVDSDTLLALGPDDVVWLGEPPVPHPFRGARPHKGRVLLAVDGVDDRTAAEQMRGVDVRLAMEHRSPLGVNEALVEDLVGCRLLSVDGLELGRVIGVMASGAHDLLEVETLAGPQFVPMVGEWLRELRLEEAEIVMELPDGLLAGAGADG
jgi:16S rRNA processing protein RimM